MEVVLYRKNKMGVGSWRCWYEGNTVFVAHAQVVGGSEVTHSENVPRGLAGRSLTEQLESRVNSRANHQRDKGYVDSVQEAWTTTRTNALNMPMPMLAKKLKDLRGWPGKVAVQPKFDGFRLLVTKNEDGEVFGYSRQGKVLAALNHIYEPFQDWLPDDVVLDGEIYKHGVPLQAVASLAKRKQSGTEGLTYHVYDCMDEEAPYSERRNLVDDMLGQLNHPRIVPVETSIVTSMDEVWEAFARHRDQGYEGSMLRILESKYDSGNRSGGLLKVKAREDAEFRVLDVIEGQDGCGILVLSLPMGKTFRTLAPGTHDRKKQALAERDRYVGRMVTVEFANYTNDGVPFHAVATRWKEHL